MSTGTFNLEVAGERASNAGIAVLTLGGMPINSVESAGFVVLMLYALLGGLSLLSPRTGLVCDSVQNSEVVLTDESVVNANEASNRNLGITLKRLLEHLWNRHKFTVRCFSTSKPWAGYVLHPLPQALR